MLTINNTLDGYAKDVEILGNTVQDASNLADIRSVGDKVEGQELYEIPVLSYGKNLFDGVWERGTVIDTGLTTMGYQEYARGVNFIRVQPNTNYILSHNCTYNILSKDEERVAIFDEDKNVLQVIKVRKNTFITPDNAYYIIPILRGINNPIDLTQISMFQLEEGTVATPYEPYQEDKLTILSPVQLERVGNVADRIIEKDGVWGVEKNVAEKTLSSYGIQINNWRNDENSKSCLFKATDVKNINQHTANIICDKLQVVAYEKLYNYEAGISTVIGYDFGVRVLNSVLGDKSLKQYIDDNNIKVKYPTTNPQFIPLPHDQQVKLRTFANKTNISFLTEIEGTIKAQVPKSLGATVNTHTEQISNLNKELDRVKKLEESTVSTVETESDFTTVEATSSGYFEDVKLEGRTLIVNADNEVVEVGTEGATLKSVGDGTDEIVVSSVNDGNLFDGELELGSYNNNDGTKVNSASVIRSKNYIPTYRMRYLNIIGNEKPSDGQYRIFKYDENKNYLGTFLASKTEGFELESNVSYITFHNNTNGNLDLNIIISSTREDFSDCVKSDKKRLLYYNDETQSWEKPILREWDSIEKHADGKYYYHKRSSEVMLNGSENWRVNIETTNNIEFVVGGVASNMSSNVNNAIFDKFKTSDNGDYERAIISTSNHIYVTISKAKLPTQDAQGFKQWLQANNVTVVYQLAQEKVYECTNIDLITYANETNYIVNCGAIVPKTTLKVHNNISNVVSLLQKKVSLLESNITSYMITQNRLQLSSTYSADSVTFKVDYAVCSENRSQENYNTDLYNLILNNILVGKDNYDYDHMFNIIMDYASWSQISWEQFDILVGIMDLQHNPPIEPPIEEVPCETPEE